MKAAIAVPIVLSIALGWFMLAPDNGFVSFVDSVLSAMDYTLTWTLTPAAALLVAVTPWMTYVLLRTPGNRTLPKQLGINLLFLVLALAFFAFGFLALELKESGPMSVRFTDSFYKEQPFPYYWAIWFALSDIFVAVLVLLNRRHTAPGN